MNVFMYETRIAYSDESSLYTRFEKLSGSKYNRRCIDGKITGCGSCVGYCQFAGHPGFLTAKLRDEHDCLAKGCHYYLQKPQRIKTPEKRDDTPKRLLTAAQSKVADMEGLRVLKAAEGSDGWVLSYITISNGYSLDRVAFEIWEELGISVRFVKLNYKFEICVQLLMAV